MGSLKETHQEQGVRGVGGIEAQLEELSTLAQIWLETAGKLQALNPLLQLEAQRSWKGSLLEHAGKAKRHAVSVMASVQFVHKPKVEKELEE